MKNTFKKLSALLMAMVMMLSIMTTAFAANPKMIILAGEGQESAVEWTDNEAYLVKGDLFSAGFKGVMPGDTVEDEIYIQNKWSGYDYIQLFMNILPHSEENAPEADVTVADNNEFLSQLNITIWDAEKKDEKIIYQGKADGVLEENYLLGYMNYSETAKLIVALEVPVTLGNDFANRIGEIDWKFTYHGENYPDDPPPPVNPPKPTDPTEPTEDVDDPDVPLTPVDPPSDPDISIDDPDVPKTGDMTQIVPYVALLILGFAGLILPLFKKKKAKED
ncbi:MAG: LPXTG cell wall anchor domain-containing protein [Clostridia bacterium]|nr:LPXTG cell wall anchor domain-containing protein [Clostridia bacterium]